MSSSKKSSNRLAEKFASKTALTGSARKIPEGKNTGYARFNEVIEVTVTLRSKTSISNYVKGMSRGKQKPVSREVYNRRFGASADDVRLVREFAQLHNLTIVQTSLAKTIGHFKRNRSAMLRGFRNLPF